jgi:RNA polymerase sigma-70 factor (ECF subfamily)
MTTAVALAGMSRRDEARDAEFQALLDAHLPALQRLARGYEADPERRRDLVQEVLAALWRALPSFEGTASLRTWVFRVAHNTAISASVRPRAGQPPLLSLEDAEAQAVPGTDSVEATVERRVLLAHLERLLARLKPIDRAVMLLALEGLGPAEIADVTGLTPGNVSVKVHRLKTVLARQASEGGAP